MANLTRQQELNNSIHMKHQLNSVMNDQNCVECKRIVIKTEMDAEEAWKEYCRRNAIPYEPPHKSKKGLDNE